MTLDRLLDLGAAATPVGLGLGRLANFINGELYGRAGDVPWAMIFPNDPQQIPRHPSQLYEGLLEGLVLFTVIRIATHRFQALPAAPPASSHWATACRASSWSSSASQTRSSAISSASSPWA